MILANFYFLLKVTLYGKLGDSGEWKLDNKENNFERGKLVFNK